jgi:hypothetical protein
MKIILAAAFTLSMVTLGFADAAPRHHAHKVCSMRHHHRVCHWVR